MTSPYCNKCGDTDGLECSLPGCEFAKPVVMKARRTSRTYEALVQSQARCAELQLLLNDRDEEMDALKLRVTDADGMLEALSAEKYALEDQVRGLQELMDLPSGWLPLAHKFQEVGLAYWKAHSRERGPGAVKFLHNDETGAMFVVTRGEYADQLKDFILSLDNPVMCRGDKSLGTACGSCKRCKARDV